MIDKKIEEFRDNYCKTIIYKTTDTHFKFLNGDIEFKNVENWLRKTLFEIAEDEYDKGLIAGKKIAKTEALK